MKSRIKSFVFFAAMLFQCILSTVTAQDRPEIVSPGVQSISKLLTSASFKPINTRRISLPNDSSCYVDVLSFGNTTSFRFGGGDS